MATNFEQANARVEKALTAAGKAAPTGKGPDPIQSICSVYQIIRPILQAIIAAPFFPKNWKDAIEALLKMLDTICPAPKAAVPMTFEDIDAAVKAGLAAHYTAAPAAAGAKINLPKEFCAVYQAVKPILDLVRMFLPAPWGAAIAAFEVVADAICK